MWKSYYVFQMFYIESNENVKYRYQAEAIAFKIDVITRGEG